MDLDGRGTGLTELLLQATSSSFSALNRLNDNGSLVSYRAYIGLERVCDAFITAAELSLRFAQKNGENMDVGMGTDADVDGYSSNMLAYLIKLSEEGIAIVTALVASSPQVPDMNIQPRERSLLTKVLSICDGFHSESPVYTQSRVLAELVG